MKKILTVMFIAIALVSCTATKNNNSTDVTRLEGKWILNYITGPRIAFNGLYPDRKPFINFDISQERVSGNSSCNSYTGKLVVNGTAIDFSKGIAMTNMACMDGKGEQVYMSTLEKITSYEIDKEGKTLTFKTGDIAMMKFTKE